jgi:hypothetical protein
MNCWIVSYTHAHGTNVWPRFQNKAPTEKEEIAELMSWEPDKGEYLDITGPFKVPRPKRRATRDGYCTKAMEGCPEVTRRK